ncbi:MAG: FUSC family protein [Proteobacteria bacterium]|nr:FUSC family protein [Pseudomonadota bacterium]
MASFPSDRLRLALIIALSITTAYAISLSMGWARPYWAGLAVAMCSLATVGESVFKAVQRLAGTALAILIALILISTLAQHRWAYALAVSLWMAFCCYRMQSTQAYYFWYCSGFIVPLLTMMSGFDSQGSFYVVVERSQETVLGVLCYVVFATALSRQPAAGAFRAKIHRQIEMLREHIAAIRADVQSAGEATGSRERHGEISRALTELPTLHASAVLESFNIRERARSWLQFIAELSRLATLLDRFHLSFTTLGPQEWGVGREMSLAALAEFEARCRAVARIIEHGESLPVPEPVAALAEEGHMNVAGNPFAAGEALLRRDILRAIDVATRDAHAWALDIADIRRHAAEPAPSLLPRSVWPDPESLLRSLTQFIAFWGCFLLYIYVPALPDGPIVAILGAIISMNVMRQPWISPPKLFIPIALAALYGGAAHILVMPALDGFAGLGALIFVGAFLIAYLLYTGRVQPLRGMALALFMVTLQVTNDGQAYSATYVFNLIVAVGIMLIAIRLATLIPVSWKADAVLLRLFRRYADNLDALLAGLRWDLPRSNSWFARQRRAYNMRQLAILPAEIAAWIEKLDNADFPEVERQALARLSDQLAALSHRVSDLARLRETKADERFVTLLKPEVAGWRQGLQGLVATLRAAEEPVDLGELGRRLQSKIEAIEGTIAKAVESGTVLDATPQGIAHMQRVLSAYRGVARALITTAELAGLADWRRLTEARF